MRFSKEEKKQFGKKMINVIIALLVVLIFDAKFMPSEDFGVMLEWWFVLLLVTAAFFPLSLLVFKRFHNNGWIFAKPLGIAITGWLLWYLSSFKLVRFTQTSCIVILLLSAVVNYVLFFLYCSKKKVDVYEIFSLEKIGSMITVEAMFLIVFAGYCYIKGYNSGAYGIEKFMDYGFVTAMLKSEYMPPHDLWLSGNSINYYYMGQYLASFIIKLSGVGAGYGYTLMMITLPALSFTLAYTIVYNVMKKLYKDYSLDENKEKWVSGLAGILGGLSLSFAGNMHYPIYKWIVPRLYMVLGKEPPAAYWFPDATRYIGHNPDIADKTTHEFPGYAYVLGDLHAHVVNIIFVLTVLGALYAWMLSREELIKSNKDAEKIEKVKWVKEIFAPSMCLCMFFVGLFNMTNTWDFPIYFVVSGGIVLFTNLITFRYKKQAWILTGLQALAYIVVWAIVSLPFTLSFDSIATYVRFVDRHSRFYQLMVLWGLPATLVLIFVIRRVVLALKKKGGHFFPRFFDNMTLGELYICTIGVCALGLVLMPEVVYVADIYGGEYQRTNTMFKLTYQAYILFAIAMTVIIVFLMYFKLGKHLRRIGIVALTLFLCTVAYFFEACSAWFTGYYKSLDASWFLASESPDDEAGIEWINENVPGDAIVLEMFGLSYTFFNRISVFTGNSTVLGWQTHEWLWRSSGDKDYPEIVTNRRQDVLKIYTSQDIGEVKALIDKYDIDYIYVGEAEHFDGYSAADQSYVDAGTAAAYHGGNYLKIETNEELLKQLGEVHMISEATDEKPYDTYIIEIDK